MFSKIMIGLLRGFRVPIFKDYTAAVRENLPAIFAVRNSFGRFALRVGPLLLWGWRARKFRPTRPLLDISGQFSSSSGSASVHSLSQNIENSLPRTNWKISRKSHSYSSGSLIIGRGSQLVHLRDFSSTFFHFFLEIVPLAIQHFGKFAFVLPEERRFGWQIQILEYLNLPYREAISGGFSGWELNSLVAGSYPTREAVQELRSHLGLEVVPSDADRTTSRGDSLLWLARSSTTSNMKSRFVVNQDQVILELSKIWRVTSVELGTLPFSEQVKVINEADIIVSPHGSALSMLVTRRVKPRLVVIISGPRKIFWHFQRLSHLLGIEVRSFVAEEALEKHMRVDGANLVAEVQKALHKN